MYIYIYVSILMYTLYICILHNTLQHLLSLTMMFQPPNIPGCFNSGFAKCHTCTVRPNPALIGGCASSQQHSHLLGCYCCCYRSWLVVCQPLWKRLEFVNYVWWWFSTEWKNENCSKPPTRDVIVIGCYTMAMSQGLSKGHLRWRAHLSSKDGPRSPGRPVLAATRQNLRVGV